MKSNKQEEHFAQDGRANYRANGRDSHISYRYLDRSAIPLCRIFSKMCTNQGPPALFDISAFSIADTQCILIFFCGSICRHFPVNDGTNYGTLVLTDRPLRFPVLKRGTPIRRSGSNRREETCARNLVAAAGTFVFFHSLLFMTGRENRRARGSSRPDGASGDRRGPATSAEVLSRGFFRSMPGRTFKSKRAVSNGDDDVDDDIDASYRC